jgi:hypothetical protein
MLVTPQDVTKFTPRVSPRAEQCEGKRPVFRIGPDPQVAPPSRSKVALISRSVSPIRLTPIGPLDVSAFPSLNRGERRRIQARSSLATTDRILIDCFMADRLTSRFMMTVKHPHLDSGPC